MEQFARSSFLLVLFGLLITSPAYAANIFGYECQINVTISDRIVVFFQGLLISIGSIIGLIIIYNVARSAEKRNIESPFGIEDAGDFGEWLLYGLGAMICGAFGGLIFAFTDAGCGNNQSTSYQPYSRSESVPSDSTVLPWDNAPEESIVEPAFPNLADLAPHKDDFTRWAETLRREFSNVLESFPEVSVIEPLATIRIPPKYPERAIRANKEGYVIVGFSIDTRGRVQNPFIVEARPRGWGFESAALEAVSKWQYKPRTVNGVAVVSTGMEARVVFELRA